MARELHDGLLALTKHFAGLGRGLGKAVSQYNGTVAALESAVLPASDRLRRLGIGSHRARGKVVSLVPPRAALEGEAAEPTQVD